MGRFFGRRGVRSQTSRERLKGISKFFRVATVEVYSTFAQRRIAGCSERRRAAGELGLIRDAELRAQLAEYYTTGSAEQAGYLTRLIPPYRDTIRGKTPVPMARHIWRECITTDGLDWQMLQECDAPFGDEQAHAVLDGYVDPVALEQLRSWIGNQEIALILLQNNLAAAERMIAQIGARRRQ
jgi:hypothetical protein